GGLEVWIELKERRLELGEQAAKRAGHKLVVAGAVQVEPKFIIIVCELPEKSERLRRESPKPAFKAPLGHRPELNDDYTPPILISRHFAPPPKKGFASIAERSNDRR